MNRKDILIALEPHTHRPVRAFLRGEKREVGQPSEAEAAFWDAVHANLPPRMDHADAVALVAALESSSRKVGEVLEGWRP